MVPETPTVTNNPVELVKTSSLLLLQEMKMELKRRRKIEMRMMSICLTMFPISGLGKPKLYQNMLCFTRMWGFYLDGSEYEFIIEEPTNKPSMLTVCFTSL
jgi:hypothetical protein